jgi:hypothetical protein
MKSDICELLAYTSALGRTRPFVSIAGGQAENPAAATTCPKRPKRLFASICPAFPRVAAETTAGDYKFGWHSWHRPQSRSLIEALSFTPALPRLRSTVATCRGLSEASRAEDSVVKPSEASFCDF